jgi:hypothetical protein
MPSPLVDLATADRNRYQASLAATSPLLGTAKQSLDTQQGLLATAIAAFGAKLDELKPLRAALAASPMPADAIALAGEFEALIAEARGLQAGLIAAQKLEDQDGAQLSYLKDVVDRATRKAPVTQAALDAATSAAAEHDAWVTALGAPPLQTLAADAQAALDGAGAAAKTRLQHDIQPELYALAESRYTREAGRQQRVRDASTVAAGLLAKRLADDGGLTAVAAQKTGDYTAAFDAFEAYVVEGPERLARAVAALAAINASPALTAEELARMVIPEIHDPGVTATTVVGPVEAAEAAVAVAQQTYDDAVLTAREADPEVDLTTVPEVGTAKDGLKSKADALETVLMGLAQPPLTAGEKAARDAWGGPAVPDAIDDLETMIATMLTAAAASTADQRSALAAWEATVPDTTWDAFVAYEAATAELTALAGLDPTATLAPALDAAETALHDALAAAQQSERAQWLLQEEAKKRAALAAAESAGGRTRLTSATRGDG